MKQCKKCSKELKSGIWCSKDCQTIFRREEKIKLWLEGKHNGMRGKTSTAYWIKYYLKKERGNKCEQCGWGEENKHTNLVPIELDHIDGDFTNNAIKNLRLLCPNCHSLTESYKGGNKNKGRPRSKYYRGS